MRGPGTPTLDQLAVILAVADSGSLAAAARRLGRGTSAISYAVDKLEAQLGVRLFDRVATRKPRLTKAGEAVIAEVRLVMGRVDGLRATVSGLLQGLEPEVSIVVDVLLPTSRLVDALTAFQRQFPTVALRLHVEALGAVSQLVLSGNAIFGVSGTNHVVTDLERIVIDGVQMVPVAAPTHPLAQPGEKAASRSSNYTQLVLTDRSPLTDPS